MEEKKEGAWIGVGLLIFSALGLIISIAFLDFYGIDSIITMAIYILISLSVILSFFPSISSDWQFWFKISALVGSIIVFFLNNWFISNNGTEGHLNPICSILIVILVIILMAGGFSSKA